MTLAAIYIPIWVIPSAALALLCACEYLPDAWRWHKHRRKLNDLWRD